MAAPVPVPEDATLPLEQTLRGQVAIVTGASRGIGRAVASLLARRGAALACVATRAENCEPCVEDCRRSGVRAAAYGVDVADTQAVAALVTRVQEELGGLHVLVNNAGLTRDQILLRMSEEDFDRVVAVNLKGAWNFLRAATRALMKVGGAVVNVSSVVGLTGNAGQANYAASKAGLLGLTRAAAKELASRNVRVNAVAPGFVETDMTAGLGAAGEELLSAVPLRRMGRPEDVAWAVDYLVGPHAAYVTGHVLVVDGGLSI